MAQGLPNRSALVTPLQLQTQGFVYFPDTGAANVYQIAPTPTVVSVSDGMTFNFKASAHNTGPSTFNVGLGNSPLINRDGSALATGAVKAGVIYLAVRNGSNWVLNDTSLSNGGSGITAVNRIILSANRTTVYTPSAGMVSCLVELQAEGGSGGGAQGAQTTPSVGFSGGGGVYTSQFFTARQLGASATLVQSVGVTTPGSGTASGTDGGNSTFTVTGTWLNNVGQPELGALGGTGGFNLGNVTQNSVYGGGFASTAATNFGEICITPGATGMSSIMQIGSSTNNILILGAGGTSYLSTGGVAQTAIYFANTTDYGLDGTDAPTGPLVNGRSGYGGGGGPCFARGTSSPDRTGGYGGPAVCIITEYIQ